MTLEPYYDSERSLYVIPGPVLLEIIATAQRDEREECARLVDEFGEEWICDSHELSKLIRARGQE